jgi:hypothetical protein
MQLLSGMEPTGGVSGGSWGDVLVRVNKVALVC